MIDFEKELSDNMPLILSALMTRNFSAVVNVGAMVSKKYMHANRIQPLGAQTPAQVQAQIANLSATQEAFLTFCLDYFSKNNKNL